MSAPNLKEQLMEYYSARQLSPEPAERLVRVAGSDTNPRGFGGLRSLRLGVAACIGLLAVSVTLQIAQLTRRPGETIEAPVADRSPQKKNVSKAVDFPRLVAVKFHMDGCPFSAETAPAFTELFDKYGNRAIVFAKYDMTDEDALKHSRMLARELGIDWTYKGQFQSGLIEVVDRERGEIVASLSRRAELPELERVLDRVLP